MLSLFFSLFASQEVTAFRDAIENTFNITKCTSYVLQQPLFPVRQIPEEHIVTLYIPLRGSKNPPDECFVITNGYDGKQLFFSALKSGQLDQWSKIPKNTPDFPSSFSGYKEPNTETFALMGLYRELSTDPLRSDKFTTCSAGDPYTKLREREKEREAQDEEARRFLQRNFGRGAFIVYPAEGIPHGDSQYATFQ